MAAVEWVQADAMRDDLEVHFGGVDAVVSCIGSKGSDLLRATTMSWSGNKWTQESHRQYALNCEANLRVVKAAEAAGVKRFSLVGAWSIADLGFAGSLPGIYMGKADAARAAQTAFGDEFFYVGPHAVVEESNDPRRRVLGSGLGKGLLAVNGAIGKIRTFGEDYAATAGLTPPVCARDLAVVIAAAARGVCRMAPSERRAGVTTPSDGSQGILSSLTMKHVDGPRAIEELARSVDAQDQQWKE